MTKGERIVELRERRGIGQTDLAERAGISKQTLYKYENDIVTNIPSDKVEALAAALNTAPAYLMGWQPEDDPKEAQKSRLLAYYEKLSEIQKVKLVSYAEGLSERED